MGAVTAGACLVASSVAIAAPFETGVAAVERAVRSDEQTQVIASPTAQYRLTLSINWTRTTHPNTLPSNAHVSSPIMATHPTPGAMFRPGALASPGIESMAETGGVTSLLAELNADPGVTLSATEAGVFGTADRVFTFTLSQGADLVSLTTMLAPSPDWFVGFADRDMFVDGAWIESSTFPLGNYDAGTDSGSRFQSPNADAQPATVITGPTDVAFAAAAAEGPFGTVHIERVG